MPLHRCFVFAILAADCPLASEFARTPKKTLPMDQPAKPTIQPQKASTSLAKATNFNSTDAAQITLTQVFKEQYEALQREEEEAHLAVEKAVEKEADEKADKAAIADAKNQEQAIKEAAIQATTYDSRNETHRKISQEFAKKYASLRKEEEVAYLASEKARVKKAENKASLQKETARAQEAKAVIDIEQAKANGTQFAIAVGNASKSMAEANEKADKASIDGAKEEDRLIEEAIAQIGTDHTKKNIALREAEREANLTEEEARVELAKSEAYLEQKAAKTDEAKYDVKIRNAERNGTIFGSVFDSLLKARAKFDEQKAEIAIERANNKSRAIKDEKAAIAEETNDDLRIHQAEARGDFMDMMKWLAAKGAAEAAETRDEDIIQGAKQSHAKKHNYYYITLTIRLFLFLGICIISFCIYSIWRPSFTSFTRVRSSFGTYSVQSSRESELLDSKNPMELGYQIMA